VSESSRSLPDQPSLRFLRLEARRRLAAGEFTGLWEAYLAIAREHGFPSWTALKQVVVSDSRPDPDEAVLDQAGWVVSRMAGAGQPDWTAPAGQELAEHFGQSFLDLEVSGRLIAGLSGMARAGWPRDEVTVITQRAVHPGPSRRRAGRDEGNRRTAAPAARKTAVADRPIGHRYPGRRAARRRGGRRPAGSGRRGRRGRG